MKRTDLISKIMLMGALVATGCTSDSGEPEAVKEAERPKIELTAREAQVALDQHDFQIDMFSDYVTSCFDKQSNNNLTFSPLSAAMAMAIIANAADDATAKTISKVMDCDDLDALNAYSAKLMSYLPYNGINAKLKLANKFWYNNSETINPAFEQTFEEVFGCKPQAAPFDMSTVKEINSWASEKTEGVFKQIVDINAFSINNKFFFANALYYKGVWEQPFDSKYTQNRDFQSIEGLVSVPMMSQEDNFLYNETNGTKIVKLHYQGDHIVMYAILPPADEDIIECASKLTSASFNQLIDGMKLCKVNLQLPKFKVYGNNGLYLYLASKGINTNNMTLSNAGINASIPFDLLQKTMLEIDEKGTTLAAITHINTIAPSFPEFVDFHANRPFIYVIQEEVSGAVLMAGIISHIPQDKE